MNVPSLVVLALVGLAAGLAIRYMIRHRGENSCGGCCESCSGCNRRTAGCAGGRGCESCEDGENREGCEDGDECSSRL